MRFCGVGLLLLSCECRITAAGLELCSTVVLPATQIAQIALLPDALPPAYLSCPRLVKRDPLLPLVRRRGGDLRRATRPSFSRRLSLCRHELRQRDHHRCGRPRFKTSTTTLEASGAAASRPSWETGRKLRGKKRARLGRWRRRAGWRREFSDGTPTCSRTCSDSCARTGCPRPPPPTHRLEDLKTEAEFLCYDARSPPATRPSGAGTGDPRPAA